jgi:hypothetical protein
MLVQPVRIINAPMSYIAQRIKARQIEVIRKSVSPK